MVVDKVGERLLGSLVLLMVGGHLVGLTMDLELCMQMMVAEPPMEVATELLLGHLVRKLQLMGYLIILDRELPHMAAVVMSETHGVQRPQPIQQIIPATTGTLANPITTIGDRLTMLQPLVVLYRHQHQRQ